MFCFRQAETRRAQAARSSALYKTAAGGFEVGAGGST